MFEKLIVDYLIDTWLTAVEFYWFWIIKGEYRDH